MMEWVIPVNDMLQDEITKISHTLIPPGYTGDVRSVRMMQESLAKVIDQLGEQSASAQGLSKVITTADKMRNSPKYSLYLLKDENGKGGKGEVIGLLKVGHKHLFLFDERERVREVEPLCVLDFYVLRDRQRHGYGRKLFDHMLLDMETMPHKLAVDGPSAKMEEFLIKNYGLGRLVRQNNNFAVSPQFFQNDLEDISKGSRSSGDVTPAVGRFSAPKPHSAIANVIHGGVGAAHDTNGVHTEETAVPSAEPEPVLEAELEVEPELAFEPEHEPEAEVEVEVEAYTEARGAVPRPRTLSVDTTATSLPSPAEPSPAGSTISRRASQLTDKGFFDVKFYHNKLW